METSSAVGLAALTFLVGYVLGRRAGARAGPAPEPVPPDLAALEAVRPVLAREGKIAAIKAYRAATGVGLRDAKLAVDTLDV